MNTLAKTAFAVVAVTAVLGAAGAAQAGGGWHNHYKAPLNYVAYDAYWKLKNPGGPVEINPQPLPPGELNTVFHAGNPGERVGFNPQPDPPGFD